MHIKKLSLYQFRNCREVELVFHERCNFIIGNNGQGKTNILEAITLLSSGKSFRTSHSQELVTFQEVEGSISATILDEIGEQQLGLVFKNGRKTPYLQGEKASSLPEFVGRLPAIWFSPADLQLVKGPPSERRSFINKHSVDIEPRIFEYLQRYERALGHKATLLREGRSGPQDLRPWNEQLGDAAAQILPVKVALCESLAREAAIQYQTFAPERETLHLSYKNEYARYQTAREITEALMQLAPRECAAGMPLGGPHKDDLEIQLTGVSARAFASQGQTRSIALALKFAMVCILEKERNTSPLVLLDDVDAELDSDRSLLLFSHLFKGDRQIVLTGTSPTITQYAPLGGFVRWTVEEGRCFLASDEPAKVD